MNPKQIKAILEHEWTKDLNPAQLHSFEMLLRLSKPESAAEVEAVFKALMLHMPDLPDHAGKCQCEDCNEAYGPRSPKILDMERKIASPD